MSKDVKKAPKGASNAQSQGELIWFDSDEFEDISEKHFRPRYWKKQNAIMGSARGRGTTYFFKHNDRSFVLRHYRRGGLIGKLLTDQYFFTGFSKTRAWREMDLLMRMKELGLPAPIPVAARVQKHFFYYRADLITKKIPVARDAHQHLRKREIGSEAWQRIGATIAQFHHHQIYHHDLNIHNIMLSDKGKVWLIDFDKCEIRTGENWKKANLGRLRRSLNKEKANNFDYHFSEDNWLSMIEGYNA